MIYHACFIVFLFLLHGVTSIALSAESKDGPLSLNSIQVGVETLSFQRSSDRIDLDAQVGILNLKLFEPFRLKTKVWRASNVAEKTDDTNTDVLGLTDSDQYQGGFGGIELYNEISMLRFSFAIGYQKTTLTQSRTSDMVDGSQEIQKRLIDDQGPAVVTSIEAQMKGFVLSLNGGASHREAADRTDAFGGVTIGIAY